MGFSRYLNSCQAKVVFVAMLLCFSTFPLAGYTADTDEETEKVVNNSIELGKSNDLEGDGIIIIGDGHEISSKYGTILGWTNIVHGDNSTGIGTGNLLNGDGSIIMGNNNEVYGNNALVIGNDSKGTMINDKDYLDGRIVVVGYKSTANGSDVVAFGNYNAANVKNATALGVHNSAHGENTVSIGFYNETTVNPNYEDPSRAPWNKGNYASQVKISSIAIGAGNSAHGSNSSAFGWANDTMGNYNAAFGTGNKTYGDQNSSFGFGNLIEGGNHSNSIGSDNVTRGLYISAIGYKNDARANNDAIAVGSNNKTYSNYGATFGYNNVVNNFNNATALGNNNEVNAENGTALGSGNELVGINSLVIGADNVNYGKNSLVVGQNNEYRAGDMTNSAIIGSDNVVWSSKVSLLGNANQTTGENAVLIGVNSHIWSDDSVAVGKENNSGALQSTIVGNKSQVWAENGLSFGNNNTVNGINGLSFGNFNLANAANSVAIGFNSIVLGESAFAMGSNTYADSTGAFVIGNNSKSTAENAFAIGNNALSVASGAVAIGSGSIAGESNTVSFGHKAGEQYGSEVTDVYDTDLTSRLVNVTAGIDDTDAVNVSQLKVEENARISSDNALGIRIDGVSSDLTALSDIAVVYDNDSNKGKVTFGGINGTLLTNVKAGNISANSTDAVNGSQLFAEQAARSKADDDLKNLLEKETSDRESSVSGMKDLLDKEIADRNGAIGNLRVELTDYVNNSLGNVVSYADPAKDKISFAGANGTLLTNLKNGSVASGSTDAVTGDQLYKEEQARKDAVSDINFRLDNIEASAGHNNSVKYDDADKSSISLDGVNGTTIKNVGNGSIAEGSMDAVNGGQLYNERQERIDADNALRQEFSDYVNGITDNTIGYDPDSEKGSLTFEGKNGTVLKNVGNGTVAEGSMEAVNGGQLFETNTKLNALTNKVGTTKDGTYVKESNTIGENINSLDEAVTANSDAIGELGSRVSSGFNILGQKINNTGAHAAALAALNPVAEDDSKFSFAAGIGSYHNVRAGAIGMFYRPSDRYQFSIGGTTGNGEHMYNLGFAVGLDKNVGGPFANKKAMIARINYLEDEVAELKQLIRELVQTNSSNRKLH